LGGRNAAKGFIFMAKERVKVKEKGKRVKIKDAMWDVISE
jgi:hypothetical protein